MPMMDQTSQTRSRISRSETFRVGSAGRVQLPRERYSAVNSVQDLIIIKASLRPVGMDTMAQLPPARAYIQTDGWLARQAAAMAFLGRFC